MNSNTEPGMSTTTDQSAEAERLMDEIAGAGYSEASDDDPGTNPTTPPEEGNLPDGDAVVPVQPHQNPATPDNGQPVDGDGKQVTPADPNADPNAVTPEEAAKTAADDAERLRKEGQGRAVVEPDSMDTLREKLSSSSRESRANLDQLTAIKEMLKAKGLDVIVTKGNQLAVAPNAEYYSELPTDQLPNTFKDMSQDEKDMLSGIENPEEAVSMIEKKVIAATKAMRPDATASTDDVVISDSDQIRVFDETAGKKLSNGSEMFPDMAKDDIKNEMADLYSDPAYAPLADMMEKSPENFAFGLGLLYNTVNRFAAPQKVIQADAAAQAAALKDKNIKGLSADGTTAVPDAGSGAPDNRSQADIEMDTIANASYA